MRHFLLILIFVFSSCALQAQNQCDIEQQTPIRLLETELKRGMKTFKKQKPPIYYLSYTYTDELKNALEIAEGGIVWEGEIKNHELQISARAGSPEMDNTRALKSDYDSFYIPVSAMPDYSVDSKAFQTALWRATQRAAEQAQKDFSRVQIDSINSSKRADDSNDFVFPPKEIYCREETPLSFDWEQVKQMLIKASRLPQGKAFVLKSTLYFSTQEGNRYFVDSVGSRIKTPFAYARMGYELYGQTADGLRLNRSKSYDVLSQQELPDEKTLLADMAQSIAELEQLSKAPEAEPMTAPAILKNRAMAVFVHEVLGHRVEGHRQKDDSFGRTFTDKVGQPVVASILTILDDPTLDYFAGVPLRGFYEYDDEGVKARPVTLVENGVLKNFLMNSSPIKGFSVSNGHGRRSKGYRPVARMGNTRVIASQTVSYEELEKMLLAEIKRQGKPYGFIIEDLSGGFTQTSTYSPQAFKLEPTFVYRIYPDGRKELVRGADMVGTPLVSFNKVLAAADDYAVFNGTCGAESGWVPVSSIAPSVLLESLEIEKTGKSNTKPPVLVPPSADRKENKR